MDLRVRERKQNVSEQILQMCVLLASLQEPLLHLPFFLQLPLSTYSRACPPLLPSQCAKIVGLSNQSVFSLLAATRFARRSQEIFGLGVSRKAACRASLPGKDPSLSLNVFGWLCLCV